MPQTKACPRRSFLPAEFSLIRRRTFAQLPGATKYPVHVRRRAHPIRGMTHKRFQTFFALRPEGKRRQPTEWRRAWLAQTVKSEGRCRNKDWQPEPKPLAFACNSIAI